MSHYKVLRPVYSPAEISYKAAGRPDKQWEVEWDTIGTSSMEDAKARYGGSPVLVWESDRSNEPREVH